MRKPAFRKSARGRPTTSSASVPAPVGGWNARDSIADMDEKDAVIMENWFPDTDDVRLRRGWASHVTSIGDQVETLMVYNKPDGTQTLFCASDTAFYNVTSAGTVGAAVVSSLTNARWESLNFTNTSGTSYLMCFNGTDSPRYWNGSSWTTVTGASSPAITGLTTSNIKNGCVFKKRVFLILNDSLKLWFLPVDSVGGAAQSIDLAGYFGKGGFLVSCEAWTLDAGEGMDDHLVAVTSEGQVAVFKGTNPTSSSSWGLVGVWNLGEPIGNRCLIKFRGDLLILTVEGVFPLSLALLSSQTNPSVALTDKIRRAMREAARNYKSNFGWEMTFYPQGSQLFLNVPVQEGSVQEQYVMNTITGSWGSWTGMQANCWAVFNEEMYFGGSGFVGKFGSVYADNSKDITTDLKQAFSYLSSKGRLKHIKSVRPNFLANGTPSVEMGISIDFGDEQPQSSLSFTPNNYGVWDDDVWDGAVWGGDVSPVNDWQTVYAIGTALALRMKTVTNGLDLRFESADYLYEYGGVIA